VAVDSPAWIENARYYKNEIMSRLVPLGIKDLKFKAGRGVPLPPSRAAGKPARALTSKEHESIEGALVALKDEELKEISRRLLEKIFRLEK
jgi:hypothetical protein